MRNKRFCWVCWIAASVAAMMAISGCVTQEPSTKTTVEVNDPKQDTPNLKTKMLPDGPRDATEIPAVENWVTTTEVSPHENLSFCVVDRRPNARVRLTKVPRIGFDGAMLKSEDSRPVAGEVLFLQNPKDANEYGGIWRYRKTPESEWIVFGKCWGLRKVDGKFYVKRGDTRSTNTLQHAVMADGNEWLVSFAGADIIGVELDWRDESKQDRLLGFKYTLVYEKDNEFRGGSGRVSFDNSADRVPILPK